jgi:hypothetical protein
MKAGKYSIKELFNNRDIEHIVIPEIQRDYVWSEKQVEGLLNSIAEDFNNFSSATVPIDHANIDIEIRNAFEHFYKKQKFSCNIGFIYAYNDPDYSGKYFLIDGQQRLTTIYLLLLVLASQNDAFREKFEKIYMFSNSPVIDYRVREASRNFLNEVVKNYKENSIDIYDEPWYYKEYKNDKTITSVIHNISTISKFITTNNLTTEEFIDYTQDYIEFWYFDTNVSEQGEELYIYMNARGEQMQENENLKADLLGKLKIDATEIKSITAIKNDWGIKWEEWQNFFFINRQSNFNADKGFNEFINCIAGLENYLSNNSIVYKKEEFDGAKRGQINQFAYSDITNTLINNGLQIISGYIEVLKYIFNIENITQFKNQYKDCSWLDKCLLEILKLINSNTTNWFANLKDSNRGLEHNRMVFLWSILHYINTREEWRSNMEAYRVLRIYYIRYNNYNRSVLSIKSDIKNINEYGPWEILGIPEENLKNEWYRYSQEKGKDVRLLEQLIWSIEDHPLNLDGRDAKAINCSHLINFENKPSLIELENIKNKFFELFPLDEKKKENKLHTSKILATLLFYGEFWERVTPWYYQNLHFGNWKKIIRNIDVKNDVFKLFFEDFKTKTLDEIYHEKSSTLNIDFETTSIHEQLKYFSIKLKEKMWTQGYYIVFDHYNYLKNDNVFKNSKTILNTKGDFKGGNPETLSKFISRS